MTRTVNRWPPARPAVPCTIPDLGMSSEAWKLHGNPALLLCGGACVRRDRAAEIAAVGLTGHGDGLYMVDRQLRPVRPAILALDSRAEALRASWRADGVLPEVLATSGQEPTAVSQVTGDALRLAGPR
jgi:hypothetical protein